MTAKDDWLQKYTRPFEGRVLAGRYKINKFFMAGGRGLIFEAEDLKACGATVLVKTTNLEDCVLNAMDFPVDRIEAERNQLRREVVMWKSYRHDSVPAFHDAFHDVNPYLNANMEGQAELVKVRKVDQYEVYLVMEYINGCPMDRFGRSADHGIMSSGAIASTMSCIGELYRYLELKEAYYTDMKRENVMFSQPLQLMDCSFGCRSSVIHVLDLAGITRAAAFRRGRFESTERCLPPEVPESRRREGVQNPRPFCIYQIGVLVAELAGCRQESEMVDERLPDWPYDEGLGRIVQRCLCHDPDARYQTFPELLADLEGLE